MDIQETIDEIYSGKIASASIIRKALKDLRSGLEIGKYRTAVCINGIWKVNAWIKRGILLLFKHGKIIEFDDHTFQFSDKDTIPLQKIDCKKRHIRIVPGGTSIRAGSYIGKNIIFMPPAYVNVGAYIDDGTLIDSHALVGSGAQVGKNVHVSAAAQVGGVLEPVNAIPVIIEDNVLLGGLVGVFEGVIIRKNAIIGAGTIITASTPVYDVVKNKIYRAEIDKPLEIPENAVVIQGSRKTRMNHTFEGELYFNTPIIIKYRDEKMKGRIQFEEILR